MRIGRNSVLPMIEISCLPCGGYVLRQRESRGAEVALWAVGTAEDALRAACRALHLPEPAEPEPEPAAAWPSPPSGLILPDGWREEAPWFIREDGLIIARNPIGLWFTFYPNQPSLATNLLLTKAFEAAGRIERRPSPEAPA